MSLCRLSSSKAYLPYAADISMSDSMVESTLQAESCAKKTVSSLWKAAITVCVSNSDDGSSLLLRVVKASSRGVLENVSISTKEILTFIKVIFSLIASSIYVVSALVRKSVPMAFYLAVSRAMLNQGSCHTSGSNLFLTRASFIGSTKARPMAKAYAF